MRDSSSANRTPFPHLTRNKRRFVRFPAMCRVEYEVDGRATFVFTQDLSLGGMQLRSAKGLTRGDAIEFRVHLLDSGRPTTLQGIVQRVDGSSAGVTFQPGQERAVSAIDEFINQRLISRTAERVVGTGGSAKQISDLAMYYCETGRVDHALELYRKSLQKRPQETALYDDMATLLLYRAEQSVEDAQPLLNELETVVARGQGLGKSRVLESVSRDLGAVRKAVADKQRLAQQRLEQTLRDQLSGKSDSRAIEAARKKLAKEQKDIDKAQKALEAAKQKHDKAAAALEVAQRTLQDEREALRAESDALKASRAEVQRREQEVSKRESRVATLEQLTRLIDNLHLANVALRPDVSPDVRGTRRSS